MRQFISIQFVVYTSMESNYKAVNLDKVQVYKLKSYWSKWQANAKCTTWTKIWSAWGKFATNGCPVSFVFANISTNFTWTPRPRNWNCQNCRNNLTKSFCILKNTSGPISLPSNSKSTRKASRTYFKRSTCTLRQRSKRRSRTSFCGSKGLRKPWLKPSTR